VNVLVWELLFAVGVLGGWNLEQLLLSAILANLLETRVELLNE
jgi:hypothetical protein